MTVGGRDAGSLFGERGGQHPLAKRVDHAETYGPRIVERFVTGLDGISCVMDLGAGGGRDLGIVRRVHPSARVVAVEGGRDYASRLGGMADEVHVLDIERARLPVDDESVDLIIANQVLEHTKEIFWIFHEVTRALRVGGRFLIGVPNIASLHNRILLLFGVQPTQHKLCSAHVRPFSKDDTLKFVEACFPGGYSLRQFAGSQFYPFGKRASRILSACVPTAAFSIFFLFEKKRRYTREFAEYPARANLETNFWSGDVSVGSQYTGQPAVSED